MDATVGEAQNEVHEHALLGLESSKLRTQQESSAHIFKLPNEILLEIFLVIKARSPSLSHWHKEVNLVCRHWRAIAIGAPSLWKKPHTRQHKLALLMLERSNPVDLDIYLDSGTASYTTEAVLRYKERLGILSIRQDRRTLKETQDVIVAQTQESSRLQFLIIDCIDIAFGQRPVFRLSPRVLLGLNRLRHLRLSSIVIDWSSIPLHNLRHLQLENTVLVAKISYHQLIGALRLMPQLAVLYLNLKSTLLPHQPLPSQIGQPVHLPHLYYLTLDYALPAHLHCFLSHTELPDLRYAHIIKCDDITNYTVDDYLTTIHAIFALLESGGFGRHSKSIEIHDSRLHVLFFEPAPGSKYSDYAPHFRFSIPWFYEDDEEDPDYDENVNIMSMQFMSQLSSRIFNTARSDFLSTLIHADISRITDAGKVFRLLGKLPKLKSISIHNGLVTLLTTALSIDPDLSPDQLLPFPKLDSITWRKIYYRDGARAAELTQFRECLTLRHEYGISIHDMLFVHCTISQRELNLLSQIVPNVTYKTFTVSVCLD